MQRLKEFSKATVVFWGTVLILSLILAFTPLFNQLGYEFSLAMGFALPLLCGLYVLYEPYGSKKWLNIIIGLSLPVVVMLVNMLRVKNCDFIEGLGFYILGPIIGSILALSLALFIRKMLAKYWTLFFVLTWLCILIFPVLADLYFSPQIYFFNHGFGYFAGPIYDRVVEIDIRYLIFRLETMLLALAFLSAGFMAELSKHIKQSAVVSFIAAFALLACVIVFNHDTLGVTSSHQTIEKKMVKLSSSENWFAPTETSQEERAYLNFRLQKEIKDLVERFQMSQRPSIHIYIYPNDEVKKYYTGAGRTEFTKIWRNEIHITRQGFERSIRHELVHILFGRFGMPYLGLSKSIGLLEGIAQAYETPSLDWTLDEFSAAMFELGLAPDHPEALLSATGFWTSLGAKSYTLMGSFTRFLVEKQGIEKFKQVYANANFEKIYHKSPEDLIVEWQASLKHISVEENLRRATRYRFDRKSIFETQCPHTVARGLAEGWQALEAHRFEDALNSFERVLELTEGKNPSAVYGFIQSLLYQSIVSNEPDFYEARTEAELLLSNLEKSLPAKYLILNTALWHENGLSREDSLKFDAILDQHLSFGYDLSILYRKQAMELRLPLSIFSSLKSDEEALALLTEEILAAHSDGAMRFLKLLLAERFYKMHYYINAIELLEKTSLFVTPEIEFQRQALLLMSYLKTSQLSKAKAVNGSIKQGADTLVGANAKKQWVNHQMDLYEN